MTSYDDVAFGYEAPAYCPECGDEVPDEDDAYAFGFCSVGCYDEYEDSLEEEGD